jgi:hypothetical protein
MARPIPPKPPLKRLRSAYKAPKEWETVRPYLEGLHPREQELLAGHASRWEKLGKRSPVLEGILDISKGAPNPDAVRALVAARRDVPAAVRAILNEEGEFGYNVVPAMLQSRRNAHVAASAIVRHGPDVEVADAILLAKERAPEAAHAIVLHGPPAARAILGAGEHAPEVAKIFAKNPDTESAKQQAEDYLAFVRPRSGSARRGHDSGI